MFYQREVAMLTSLRTSTDCYRVYEPGIAAARTVVKVLCSLTVGLTGNICRSALLACFPSSSQGHPAFFHFPFLSLVEALPTRAF